MFLNKKTLACSALIFASSGMLAVGGGRGYPPGGCPGGPDSTCIPQRITYGYYPTTWRRWPTDTRGVAKAEPEVLPTPAKEPPPPPKSDTPSETPGKTPAEPPIQLPKDTQIEIPGEAPIQMPSEKPSETPREIPSTPLETEPQKTEPPITGPATELPLPLPTEESPPAPPRAKINAKELAPPEDSPEPPAQSDAVPEELKTRTPSPDDDPFQDEPTKAGDAPTKPSKARSGRDRSEHRVGQHEPIRWRVTAKAQAAAAQTSPPKPVDAGEEPQRLSNVERGGDGGPSPLPVNLATSNPLRSSTTRPRVDRVVPTANWSADQPAADQAGSSSRSNPLRSN